MLRFFFSEQSTITYPMDFLVFHNPVGSRKSLFWGRGREGRNLSAHSKTSEFEMADFFFFFLSPHLPIVLNDRSYPGEACAVQEGAAGCQEAEVANHRFQTALMGEQGRACLRSGRLS